MAESQDEMMARQRRELNELREGIADVSVKWAALESNMAHLLSVIVDDWRSDLGSHLYFTPNNAETRFQLISEAVKSRALGTLHRGILPEHWRPIDNKLSRLRKTRNKIVHGQIVSVGASEPHMRLTPIMLDPRMASTPRGQLPGMSGHDVKQFAQSVWDYCRKISLFCQMVQAARLDDEKALQQISSELGSNPPKPADHQKDGQTPPKSGDPP